MNKMKPKIIAIIGAPGTGKSFLSQKLAESLGASLILEEDFPEDITQNLKNDVNRLETFLWFKNRFVKDMEKAKELKKQGKTVILDTYLVSNNLHITTMFSGTEQKRLLKEADIEIKKCSHPDVVIFLDASNEKIKDFVMKRGRDFDTNEKFMQRILSIKKAHDEYLNKNRNSVIYIQRDKFDFNKNDDLQKVIELIR